MSVFPSRLAMLLPAALLAALLLAPAALMLAGCGDSAESHAPTDSTRAPAADAGTPYADEMAEQHAGDRPVASPAAMEPDTAVTGHPVTYGDSLTGYLAAPEYAATGSDSMDTSSADSLPALIAVHEWWGLNDNIRTMARRLAGQGFRVLAVDLYSDQVAETPKRAHTLMQQATADPQALRSNVEAAYQYLAGEHAAPRVGIIGWCFGGGVALNGAIALPRSLDAAIIYYGALENATREALRPLTMPVIAFFGGQDSSIPTDEVHQFEQTLDDLGKDAQVYIYDDAGHAFANPSGERYVPSAAKDAWQKTTAFLDEHMKE